MKFSVYSSAFDVIENNIKGWKKSVKSSSSFADEVVVAVNKSSDGTKEAIEALGLENVKIIETDFDKSDPWFDGKIKNAALQATTHEIKVQIDLDEYIPPKQKPFWIQAASSLKANPDIDCLAVASVNLYKDWRHYYSISHKQYMHKAGFYRSPAKEHRKPDGTINTMFSDGCEVTTEDGTQVKTAGLSNDIKRLESGLTPFVVHFGYVDLDSRIERNEKFWQEHWLVEGGGKSPRHKIHMKHEDFDMDYITHNLEL